MLPASARRRRVAFAASMVTLAALLLTGCQTAGPTAGTSTAATAELPPLDTLCLLYTSRCV